VSSARIAEKAVVLRMIAGLRLCSSAPSGASIAGSLRLPTANSEWRQSFAVECRHQRLDRRHVRGGQVRPIEDDQRRRARVILIAEDGERSDRNRRLPRQATDKTQGIAEIVGAALPEEAIEKRELLPRHRRGRCQSRIGAIVARQRGKQDTVVPRGIGDALQPVPPISRGRRDNAR